MANGAQALTGGKRLTGAGDFFEPTVLVDVDHSMKVHARRDLRPGARRS